MAENISSPHTAAIDIEERLERFQTVLGHYEDFEDPHRRAFGKMFTEDIKEDGPLTSFTVGTMLLRPGMGSSQLLHQELRGFQHNSYRHDPAYPYETVAQWRGAVDRIFNDPVQFAAFAYDVRNRELQSNVPDRYRGLKAFMGLARDLGRLTTGSVMDIGCSRNLGLKYLASGMSFSQTDIYWPDIDDDPAGIDTVSERHTAAFQALIDDGVPLENSVGIDREDLAGPVDWARACSFYPHELLDRKRVELFDEVDAADYANVAFYQGDFDNFDDADFRAKHGESFDIVHMSTMLYQASPLQRARMIVRAMEYAKQFVVVQDFVQVDRQSGLGLKFLDDWQGVSYPYRTVVLDMKELPDKQRWQEIFQWKDGRVRAMRFCDGAVISGKTGQPEGLWPLLHERAERLPADFF